MAEEKSLIPFSSLYFLIFILSFIFDAELAQARSEAEVSLSFGPVRVGEQRLQLELSEFKLKVQGAEHEVKVDWIEGSIQWVRLKNDLLLPRARATVRLKSEASDVHVKYNDEVILLQSNRSNTGAETTLFLSLFHPSPIQIFRADKKISEVTIIADISRNSDRKTKLVDYSCAPFGLRIKGLEGRYISVGCQLIRTGSFGEEKPLLEVHWSAVNLTLIDGTEAPYTLLLKNTDPVKIKMKDPEGLEVPVEFSAELPGRLHRFGLALGLGPYFFEATENASRKKSEYAPSLMLYGNLFLTQATSLRFFNALVTNGPLFNNFGLYFGYEIGSALDKRIDLVALLGFQGLTFDYGEADTSSTTRVIYPQGFELAYRHAFGLKNYTLGLGMFIQPSDSTPYRNLWVRFGKKVFGELNLISWEHGPRKALMWGFTLAFPFGKFL